MKEKKKSHQPIRSSCPWRAQDVRKCAFTANPSLVVEWVRERLGWNRTPVTSFHPFPSLWPDGKNRQSKVLPGFLPLVQNDLSQAVEMAPFTSTSSFTLWVFVRDKHFKDWLNARMIMFWLELIRFFYVKRCSRWLLVNHFGLRRWVLFLMFLQRTRWHDCSLRSFKHHPHL